MKWKTIALLSGIVATAILLIFFWRTRTGQDQALQTALAGVVNDYRMIIVRSSC
jgi:predicted anti-sigma-YlaC factor YlaD